MRVHFRQGVGEIAEAGLARELGIRESREVDLRERHVGVERSTRLHAALDEIDRPAGDLRIDQATLVQVIDSQVATPFALAAFHDVLELGACRFSGRL